MEDILLKVIDKRSEMGIKIKVLYDMPSYGRHDNKKINNFRKSPWVFIKPLTNLRSEAPFRA